MRGVHENKKGDNFMMWNVVKRQNQSHEFDKPPQKADNGNYSLPMGTRADSGVRRIRLSSFLSHERSYANYRALSPGRATSYDLWPTDGTASTLQFKTLPLLLHWTSAAIARNATVDQARPHDPSLRCPCHQRETLVIRLKTHS